MTREILDKDFDDEVTNSNEIVLVDFWAEWCGPCRMLAPIIDQISNEMDKIKVFKMNIEENPNTPSKLGIKALPTLMLFKDGQPIGTKIGMQTKNSLEDWISSLT